MPAFLTAAIAPVAARFREQLDDFVVEEIPAYEPSGEGTHTYLWVEKRGLPTLEAVRRVARALDRRPRDVGYAGLKDARGVTRQYLSIEHVPDETLARLTDPTVADPAVRVLRTERHRNKLKKGHLHGNRFTIRLRGLDSAGCERAEEVLRTLARLGVPNGFGPQRFGGAKGTTAAVGFALLRGEAERFLQLLLGGPDTARSARVREARERFEANDLAGAHRTFPKSFVAERAALDALLRGADAHAAARRIPRSFRSIYVSAAQSLIFNELLAARLASGRFGTVDAGDRVFLHNKGAVFLVEDEASERPRAAAFEISAAGPLFGDRVLPAGGAMRQLEAEALARHGVQQPHPDALEPFPRGDHRPFRIQVSDLEMTRAAPEGPCPPGEPDGPFDLVVSFRLDRGAYATSVLREVFKGDAIGTSRANPREGPPRARPQGPNPQDPGPQALTEARARAALKAALGNRLPDTALVVVTPHGICGRRSELGDAGFQALERLLAADPSRALRVFDFALRREDVAQNVHDGDRFVPDYAGVLHQEGGRVYRVDHHYPVRELERESTTPMVRRWLLALHEAGASEVLADVACARYLVNHWDVDILFAQHLADHGQDRAYVDQAGAVFAAAALRNDYLAAPPSFLEPMASAVFFAGLALEQAITRGEVTFEVALKQTCLALGRWIRGEGSKEERARFEEQARAERAGEQEFLDRMDGWAQQGGLVERHGGRLVWLDAPERVDNAALFLFLQQRRPLGGPRVQLLSYPRGAAVVTYKIRSHGGLDLNPIFAALNREVEGASFGGRSAAGGSRPMPAVHAAVLAVLERAALEEGVGEGVGT